MTRFVFDVHGHYERYYDLVKNCQESVQLGDLGFKYDILDKLDAKLHKVVSGNHDNMDIINTGKYNHFLGDFGIYESTIGPLFFIRGELSVDKKWRTPGRNWWEQEELNWEQARNCVIEYERVKPDFVISHGLPWCVVPMVATNPSKIEEPSNTAQLLDRLFQIHRPKVWIGAHHHNDWRRVVDDTLFICGNELSYIDLKSKTEISDTYTKNGYSITYGEPNKNGKFHPLVKYGEFNV